MYTFQYHHYKTSPLFRQLGPFSCSRKLIIQGGASTPDLDKALRKLFFSSNFFPETHLVSFTQCWKVSGPIRTLFVCVFDFPVMYMKAEWLLYWQAATRSGFPLDLCQVYLGEGRLGRASISGQGGRGRNKEQIETIGPREKKERGNWAEKKR